MDVKLQSLQTVLLVLTCLVPGYILHSTYSLFSLRRSETKELLFLRFLAFSALNLFACFPLIKVLAAKDFVHHHPWWAALLGLTINFASPLALGLLIAALDQYRVLKRCAGRLGLAAMHSIPTAWDYKFSQLSRLGRRWVLVTLKDAKQVGGVFSSSSLASSENAERDLYLEEAYAVETDGSGKVTWQKRPGTDGILIKGEEIRYVEFIHPEQSQSPEHWSLLRLAGSAIARLRPRSTAQPQGQKEEHQHVVK
jgi:hypothetical protein